MNDQDQPVLSESAQGLQDMLNELALSRSRLAQKDREIEKARAENARLRQLNAELEELVDKLDKPDASLSPLDELFLAKSSAEVSYRWSALDGSFRVRVRPRGLPSKTAKGAVASGLLREATRAAREKSEKVIEGRDRHRDEFLSMTRAKADGARRG